MQICWRVFNKNLSDWTAVEVAVNIHWDIEGTPLQIKSDSTVGSDEEIRVNMYDEDSSFIGGVLVKFSSTMQYWIGYCTSGYTDLPVQPPVEVDKIWTTTKTENALNITCNNDEVLNYLFAVSSTSTCVTKLSGDVVEQINFEDSDIASEFYRAKPGILTKVVGIA